MTEAKENMDNGPAQGPKPDPMLDPKASQKIDQKSKPKTTVANELKKFACYCAIGYLVLLGIMYSPIYTWIVLRPDRNDSELYKLDKILGVPREECYFESNGKKLYAWFFKKEGSKVVVLIHHGNAGNLLNRLFLVKAFLQSGASVFLYDYRGYGKSEGTATSLNGIREDGLAAFDFVREKFNFPVIVNCGESIGSVVACNVDANRKADALILQSGLANLPDVGRHTFPIFNVYPNLIWPQPLFDNVQTISSSTRPLLLLHGNRDTMVPASHSQLLLNASASKDKLYVNLPSCGHNDIPGADTDLYQKTINDFMSKHFSKSLQI